MHHVHHTQFQQNSNSDVCVRSCLGFKLRKISAHQQKAALEATKFAQNYVTLDFQEEYQPLASLIAWHKVEVFQ